MNTCAKNVIKIAFLSLGMGSCDVFAGNLPGMPDWNNFHPGLPAERECRPIHDAAKALDVAKVQQLVSQGANINDKGCFFTMTPLQVALEVDYTMRPKDFWKFPSAIKPIPKDPAKAEAMAKWLLDNGAAREINYQSADFLQTALHCAVDSNLPRVVQLLLDKGADPNIVMVDGSSALMMTARDGLTECARVLVNNTKTNLRQKMRNPMLDANVDPHVESIHIAAFFNHPPIIDLLLQKGVSVNETDDFGNTALHYAAQVLSLDTARFLVSKGADKSLKNKDGLSALGEAAATLKAQNPKIKDADLKVHPLIQLLMY